MSPTINKITVLWDLMHHVGVWLLVVSWQAVAIWCLVQILLSIIPQRWNESRYWISFVGLALLLILPTLGWLMYAPSYLAHYQKPDSQSNGNYYLFDRQANDTLEGIANEPWEAERLLTAPSLISQDSFSPRESSGPSITSSVRKLIPYLGMVWLLIVSILFSKILFGLIVLNRLRTLSQSPSDTLACTWNKLVKEYGIKREVTLLVSDQVDAPMLFGFVRPAVVVPDCLDSILGPQEIERVLAHEIAHLKRKDLLLNPIQILLENMMFFHPCSWNLSRTIRMQREFCCDAIAADRSVDKCRLGNALLKLVENRLGNRPRFKGYISAMGGETLQRIQRLCDSRAANRKPLRFLALVTVLLCLFCSSQQVISDAIGEVAPTSSSAILFPDANGSLDETTTDRSDDDGTSDEPATNLAKIGGIVVDEKGVPVSGALVVLQCNYGGGVGPITEASQRTGSDGCFQFSEIKFHNARKPWGSEIWVHASNHDVKCVCPFYSPTGPEECRISLSAKHSFEVDVDTAWGRPSNGAVFMPYTMGVPAGIYESDTQVGLINLIPSLIVDEIKCTTENGRGYITGIDLQNLGSVKVSHSGMADQLFYFSSLIDLVKREKAWAKSGMRETFDVKIELETQKRISVRLQPTGNIVGKISGIEVDHVTGREVLVGSSRDFGKSSLINIYSNATCQIDENGEFHANGLLLGKAGATLEWDPQELLQPAGGQTAKDLGPTTQLINLDFQPAIKVLGRVVTADTKEPIPHATLLISGKYIRTSDKGDFEIRLLTGEYLVQIIDMSEWKDGADYFAPMPTWVKIDPPEIDAPSSWVHTLADIECPRLKVLTINVRNVDGMPLARRSVAVIDEHGRVRTSGLTDDDGVANIREPWYRTITQEDRWVLLPAGPQQIERIDTRTLPVLAVQSVSPWIMQVTE